MDAWSGMVIAVPVRQCQVHEGDWAEGVGWRTGCGGRVRKRAHHEKGIKAGNCRVIFKNHIGKSMVVKW